MDLLDRDDAELSLRIIPIQMAAPRQVAPMLPLGAASTDG